MENVMVNISSTNISSTTIQIDFFALYSILSCKNGVK